MQKEKDKKPKLAARRLYNEPVKAKTMKLPIRLLELIKERAANNMRSAAAEICYLLEQSIKQEELKAVSKKTKLSKEKLTDKK